MSPLAKPLAVFGFASCVSLVALYFAADLVSVSATASHAAPAAGEMLGEGYRLGELEVFSQAMYHVSESYVDKSRINYALMFDEALAMVELRVPTTMFRRSQGEMLHVQVGDAFTVVQVPDLANAPPEQGAQHLIRALEGVALFIEEHLDEDSIRRDEHDGDVPALAYVEYALVNGALSTLDPHSLLLQPIDSREMDEDNSGQFGGLGITISADRRGRLIVEYPMPNTPAERGGIQSNDQIVRIDGESTIDMTLEDAITRLRGPVGAPVLIEVKRKAVSEPISIPIIRELIKLNPVEGQVLDGAIGYIAIPSFNANVSSDLDQELARLKRQNANRELRGLVLDLRGNPGGYLNQAVAVSDKFLDHGTIVSTVDGMGREGGEEVAREHGTEPFYPIVVLLNSNSASASEIVAGALSRNDRAVILGERSFGKGSVQNLHPFHDQSKLKLTVSKYLTPGGHSIQEVGIPADIELVPAIVEVKGPSEELLAMLYWRERVRREADLDQHLERQVADVQGPIYTVPYLRPFDMSRRSAKADLSGDVEVQIARDVLLASTGWRRSQVLAPADRVVRQYAQRGALDIQRAFHNVFDIDWRDGVTRGAPELSLSVQSNAEGMRAGQEGELIVQVTNTGDVPVYRLGGVSTSHEELFDGREFFFGFLAPGQTRSFTRTVHLPAGYPTEHTPVHFELRDGQGNTLLQTDERVAVTGRPQPRLEWSWAFDDRDGNGDGVAQLGETLGIEFTVVNVGLGPTAEARASLKNRSRSAIDLVVDSVEPGVPRDEHGHTCDPESVGDAHRPNLTAELVQSDEVCRPILRPGESWTGRFEIALRESPEDQYGVDITLADYMAYDHASIVREGFYGYFSNTVELRFGLDEALPKPGKARPPTIEISRGPQAVSSSGSVTLSGVVKDDAGVDYVLVYHGDDKVFLEGSSDGGAVRSVPFTADVQLVPGPNVLSVLTSDIDGLRLASSVVTFYDAPESTAHLEP